MKKMIYKINQLKDTLGMVINGGPAICNIAITNICNAKCDFCNYARDKKKVKDGIFVDFHDICNATDILYRKGVRYITFSGGEPFLHPHLKEIVAYSVSKGIRPSICTNGSRLNEETLRDLWECGLRTLIISIDASSVKEHEENRGLPGVCEQIRDANLQLSRLSIKSIASVTISKLISDYSSLLKFLQLLGFKTVTFSYPKRSAGSSSLVFSESSFLIDYRPEELINIFKIILQYKSRFSILNPAESLLDMIRLLKGERQMFPCFGGYKYFFMDWNMDIWRCDVWPSRMCSVYEFENTPFIRDGCTQCMSDCYRDSSVLLHFVVALRDSLDYLKHGEVTKAAKSLCTRSTASSVKALLKEWDTLRKLAKWR